MTDDLYELLPWYASGTLDAADAARVERALATDPALRESLARIEEEREETVLFNQSQPAPKAGGLDALMARIETEAPRRDRVAAQGTGWLARLTAALSPRVLALAAVAAALVIIAESGVLLKLWSDRSGDVGQYITASIEPPAPGEQAVLLVAFTDTATIEAITKLLRADNATIIDGPKAGGLYRIAVAPADAETVLADLKAHPDLVRFAGPGK